MQTSVNGRKFIEQFEGLDLDAYNDGTGVLTIGYGHTTAAGPPKVTRGMKITEEQADQILSLDLGKVEAQITQLVTVPLNQNQFDALVSFQFNTGALGKSTALKLLNQGNYTDAANALLLYNRAGGRVMAGLVRRRQAEKVMFLSAAPMSKAGPIAATATLATGTATASANPHLWYWIIGGTIIAAIVIGLAVHFYNRGK